MDDTKDLIIYLSILFGLTIASFLVSKWKKKKPARFIYPVL